MSAHRDSRTGLPERLYVAAFGASANGFSRNRPGVMYVRVIGAATDLACREAVSDEVESMFGVVPEYVAQIATGQAQMELVL